MTRRPLSERRASGLRVIPFERNSEGLSLSSPLWENWAARILLLGGVLKLISPARLRKACDGVAEVLGRPLLDAEPAGRLALRRQCPEADPRPRDRRRAPTLIIAAQPTRGLDVGATAFVWRSLREARARGCGILLISSDLDELFDISDRVVVMLSGRISGEFRPPYQLGEVGAAMTGAGR